MTRTALVIPTNRPDRLSAFQQAWAGARWNDVIVVYDGPRSECAVNWPGATVYCWDDYASRHGEAAWIFSRRDSACRSFGFLQAMYRGADYVVSLDDDCFPSPRWDAGEFVDAHLRCLEGPPRWISSVAGMSVRGMPEGDAVMGQGPPVLLNMGLWCGVPDLSAKQTLALQATLEAPARVLSEFVPPRGVRVSSPHQLFPLCGMNFSFRRGGLPALYFPRMGEGSPYSRFDDVWCGLLLQRICAHTGDLLTVGEPWVQHTRASDVYENLRKEAPGVAAHERYWRIVSDLKVAGSSLADCVLSAAEGLRAQEDPYLASWGRALATWVSLCADAEANAA